MAEQTIEERLNELKQKQDYVGDPFGANDLRTLIEGIEYAMSHGGDVSVAVTPVENGYKITVTDSEGNTQEATVQNGGDAYAVYVSTVPEGQTPMGKTEWLASLKGATGNNGHNPCVGRFTSYSDLPTTSVQNGDYAYVDTVSNGEITSTKVYHYTTEWEDETDGVEVTGTNTAFNSGQDIADTPIKDLDGNTDQTAEGVLSAEAGKELDEKKLNEVYQETTLTALSEEADYPKDRYYLKANGDEDPIQDNFKVHKYAVTAGDTYYITGKTGSSSATMLACFYDSNDDVITEGKIYSGEQSVNVTQEKHVAPNGASYLRVQQVGSTLAKCEKEEVVSETDNQERINSIGDIDNLDTTNKTSIVAAINEVKSGTIPPETTYEDISLSDAQAGFYSSISVGTTRPDLSGATSGYVTKDVAVQAGEVYIGTSKLGGNSLKQFIFWGSNNKCVSFVNTGDSEYHANVRVTVPDGAVLMSFCGNRNYSSGQFTLKKEIVTTIANKINSIENEVSQLNSDVEVLDNALDTIIDVQQSPNIFDKSNIIKGYIVSSTGGLSNTSDNRYWNSGLIEVEANTWYYLSGRLNYDGLSPIRCVESDGTTAVKVLCAATGNEFSNWNLPNENGTSGVFNGQFKTPATAKYVQFTVIFNNNGSADAVMLQKIGTTYNPDFLPGEYQPFGEIVKIKDDVLPDFNTEEVIKVLLIGSSHGRNTITQFPFIAYNSGVNVEVGNVYLGSLSMQRIVGMDMRGEKFGIKFFKNGESTSEGNLSLAQIWKYDDWDYIVVQRSASDDQIWTTTQNEADNANNSYININYGTQLPAVYMSHNEALQYILNSIRVNAIKNPTVLFNSGFAKADEGIGTTQTNNKITTAGYMKEQFGLDVVPVGIAVRNARNTFMRYIGKYAGSGNEANQLDYDDEHLDFGIGCYIASSCLLEFILRKTGRSIINLKGYGSREEIEDFISVTLTGNNAGNYTEPTEETMMVAKACAMCACDTPTAVSTRLQDRFKWKITYVLSSGITTSNEQGYCSDGNVYKTTLGGTITSIEIKSRPFDRTQSATTLTENTDYTFDTSTGELVIESVEGDITITVS